MAVDQTARRSAPDNTPVFRAAPHNIEAEQALLGAILVNNESFYRVSDFLKPEHFFEPIHAKIFDLAASLVRAGKVASPITLKTFLPADLDVAGLNASQRSQFGKSNERNGQGSLPYSPNATMRPR